MLLPTPEEYDALTRLDFNIFVERVFTELNGSAPYLDNFHIGVMVAELEAVRRGEMRRLAIALPPRSLKSLVVSVAYPAWLLGHNPEAKIICASYGQQLSDDLARDCRQVMESAWYKRLFVRTRLRSDRRAIANFETTAGGFRHSTSVGGVVTGFGADIIIVDDPSKPEEALSDVERATANAWASHTLFTRLNDKANGTIVIIMQRLHEDDMIGHVDQVTKLKIVAFPAIAQQDEEHVVQTPFGSYRHLRQVGEALHPKREPIPVLDEVRRAIGNQHFDAQYLQMPSPPGGSLVKVEWFQRFDLADTPDFDQIIQSWDTASKASQLADYSVCTTWRKKGKQLYLIHVLRVRLEYPDLKRAVVTQARQLNASIVLIEEAASGIALIQDLKSDGFYKVQAVKPIKDKVMRMRSQTSVIEVGRVFIPREAHWLDDYLHELRMFPKSRHDDQVDSTAQALEHLTDYTGFEGWMQYMEEQIRRARGEPDPPSIRVNHVDKGMTFNLITGRQPIRADDGSFLVTEEEYKPLRQVPGIIFDA